MKVAEVIKAVIAITLCAAWELLLALFKKDRVSTLRRLRNEHPET